MTKPEAATILSKKKSMVQTPVGELELMEDLIPLLKKLANGREIIGLNAYE